MSSRQQNPKVLMLYTGGTIGMVQNVETGAFEAFDFEHLYGQIPELKRLNVDLDAVSLDNPIDSSDMHPLIWGRIAQQIFEFYDKYDGFVVLHGTDTMAYTASALSFMLQGLKKPIIFTGSQLPIGVIRTDGKENLITAIEIAAATNENGVPYVQEVAVYFEYSLYRGNRSKKVSANAFEAFQSPNYPLLAMAGIEIDFNHEVLFRSELSSLTLKTEMENRVAILKIFPGICIDVYASVFDYNKIKGVVIESFGAGNVPYDEKMFKLIGDFTQQGGVVVNVSQCISGAVHQGKYSNSLRFVELGVISGGDLTVEAAVTKLMFLLKQTQNTSDLAVLFYDAIAGEKSY